MFRSPARLFRIMAFAEVVSWTLLIGGMVLRATADLDGAVTIGGGIHGLVFLGYAVTAVLVAVNQRWGWVAWAVAIGSAVVPYATAPTHAWLRHTGRLVGPWRTEATQDPRDHTFTDRLLRVLLNRPVRSAAVLAVGVGVTFVVLLQVGPPDLSPVHSG